MDVTQPDGHFSPRQFATVVGLSEGSTRLALREHRISASRRLRSKMDSGK